MTGASRSGRVLEGVHVAALSLWLGALVMTGAAAAIAFPTMKRLAPVLPGFPGAEGGDHFLIAAGQVMQRVFLAGDAVGLVGLVVGGGTLAVMLARREGRARGLLLVRTALLLALVGLMGYKLFVLDARMNANLRALWSLAQAGDAAGAAAARGAFERDHPTASGVLGAVAGVLAASIVAGLWSMGRGARA